MSGKGKGGGGGLKFTRQIPNFLHSMMQQPDDGIEGALKRHREKQGDEEPEDRSEEEEERPVVVDESEALTAKQRRREETHASRGGSLQFKGSGTSTKDRFQETAAQRVADAEESLAREQQAEAERVASEARSAIGGHTFSSKTDAHRGKRKEKRKVPGVGAKGVRNEKMLSFSAEDEEG